MSDFGSTTVSIEEFRAGHAIDLLAEADVVIATDATTAEEEVIRGRHEWELALETGQEENLVVLRVELDMEADDVEWLVDALEQTKTGEPHELGDEEDGVQDED